jgi:2-dehydro-3-deoxygluconokinase
VVEMGIPYVVLKEGRRGSTVFTRGQRVHAPPYEVTEVDPTGAGDCYDAGFVYGLAHGWQLDRCAEFANTLGALTVRMRGAMEGFRDHQEVMAFMAHTPVTRG